MRILKCGPIFHDRNDSALFLKPSVRKDVILGMEKNRVRLQICGTDYYVTTEDDVEYTQSLGAQLDETISGLMHENERLSLTQAAILASLDAMDAYRPARAWRWKFLAVKWTASTAKFKTCAQSWPKPAKNKHAKHAKTNRG